MADYRIEREILIEAPADVVWRTITEPEQIAQWWADRVELDAVPGGAGLLTFENETGTHISPLVVETVEPPTKFSFRWCYPEGDAPEPGNSMLVEFTLFPEGAERTRLRISENDLTLLTWAEDDKVQYAEDHRNGWDHFMQRLVGLLADGSQS